MFKKIEIWILYLTIIISIIIALGFGVLVRQELEGVTKHGRIDISFLSKPATYIARLPEQFLMLLVVPNKNRLSNPGSEVRDFYDQNGFDGTPNSSESYLLLSRYNGDLQEGVVELVDLTNFKILHTWNPDIDSFNELVEQVDEFKYLVRDHSNQRQVLMHPKLTKDGGLIFGWGTPLHKIDFCSNLIFQNSDYSFHHAIETDIDGNIWVPAYLYPQSLPIEKIGRSITDEDGYVDDAIVMLSQEGKILFEKSVSEIFIENGLEYLLFAHGNDYEEDPIHLNDIQAVNYDGEFWKKGDVFLSVRNQSMIVLYRPSTNKIIWNGVGPFLHQHDVDIIDNHRIAVFNNRSINVVSGGNVVDGNNEVIIYDFYTDEFSTYLSDSMIKNDVRTIGEGRSEILPNGDLFVEESGYARTLYFNKDGSVNWTHVNRADNGHIYSVGWSRILYTQEDIQAVINLLSNRGICNE